MLNVVLLERVAKIRELLFLSMFGSCVKYLGRKYQ